MTKRKRRTAREWVRERYPDAYECYERGGTKAIGMGLSSTLGVGKTWKAAWADAARRLRRKT